MNTKKRAIFFDRDGVINDVVDRGENFFVQGKKVRFTAPFNVQEFHMRSGVGEILQNIGQLGFLRILVTNQPDIAYGTLQLSEHRQIMEQINILPFDDIFICIHGRNDGCECKKPKPGMLEQAAQKWNIDLENSFIVGDTENDMKAGSQIGCKTVLFDTIYNQYVKSDHHIRNIKEIILLF